MSLSHLRADPLLVVGLTLTFELHRKSKTTRHPLRALQGGVVFLVSLEEVPIAAQLPAVDPEIIEEATSVLDAALMIEIYRNLTGFRCAGKELRERGIVHFEIVALRHEISSDDRDAADDTIRAVHIAAKSDVEMEKTRAVGYANG